MASSESPLWECIEVAAPGETFRLTTSTSGIVIEGNCYTPTPVKLEMSEDRLRMKLPMDHALAKRGLDGDLPKNQTAFTYLLVDDTGSVFRRWQGDVASIGFDGARVEFQFRSVFHRSLRRKLGIVASRSCPHKLFDSGCRVDRHAFTKSGSILAIDGYRITVSVALESRWACGGQFVLLSTGERVEISEHTTSADHLATVTVVVLQAKPYKARPGETVEISAGCDQEITTCRDRFSNVPNFGGAPHLPDHDPFRR